MADAPGKLPTLHDVARRAGVSHQTVSRVVNNSPNVAPHTRARILQVIEDLNYRPNRAARSLITGRSHTLHLICFELYFFEPVRRMIYQAGDHGYHVSISALRDPSSKEELQALFQIPDGHEVTACMVLGYPKYRFKRGIRREMAGVNWV